MTVPVVELPPVSREMERAAQARSDSQTKPPGSLGRLEHVAVRLAAIQHTSTPNADRACIIVFAADHGITAQGVSAWPSEVTAQMVRNFASGGAAVNVLCATHGIELQVVDAGVAADLSDLPGIAHHKIAHGTVDFTVAPAMSEDECQLALATGIELARARAAAGANVLGFGDMGIGNTSSATLLMSVLLGLPVSQCVGAGAGLDQAGVARKAAVIETASQRLARALGDSESRPELDSAQGAFQVLRHVGGFEIAMMAGAMLGAASARVPVLVDGFIASSAFLAAWRMYPQLKDFCFFAHCSAEQGHRRMLEEVGVEPLLDLQMRLGEGTGAALAVPLLRSAAALLRDMATFDAAGVSASESLDDPVIVDAIERAP
ncbi:MAG: nicotinate-nucleotide--dimethylbenzimidazole phosphoribosyltransferase [Gammaproteobacteria bacterium]